MLSCWEREYYTLGVLLKARGKPEEEIWKEKIKRRTAEERGAIVNLEP
jgi:hypothetical protein